MLSTPPGSQLSPCLNAFLLDVMQPESSPDVDTVYLAVYKHFMEAIDGIDNGALLPINRSPMNI